MENKEQEIINEPNMSKAQGKIQSLAKLGKGQIPIIVMGQDDDYNRKILENRKVNVLMLNENITRKDFMKQRNSGLNEVLCKIAAQNDIKIAVDIRKIIGKENDIEKARSLARLAQNIMLCKRIRCQLITYGTHGNADKRNIQSLFLTLGASTSQAKEASEKGF